MPQLELSIVEAVDESRHRIRTMVGNMRRLVTHSDGSSNDIDRRVCNELDEYITHMRKEIDFLLRVSGYTVEKNNA